MLSGALLLCQKKVLEKENARKGKCSLVLCQKIMHMHCWACNCILGSKTSVTKLLWQTLPATALGACFIKQACIAGMQLVLQQTGVCHRTEVLLPGIQLHAQHCMSSPCWACMLGMMLLAKNGYACFLHFAWENFFGFLLGFGCG